VATSTYDLRLFATGDREFRSVDDLDKILVPLDSFIGTRSNYDARQYEKVKEKIEDKQRRLNSLKFRSQEYLDYIEKNPYDLEMVDFYNKAINGELKTLQQDAKYIRMADDLSTQTRRDLLKENTRMQNMAKRAIIDTFEYAYGIKP
jgi:DNA repair ATPase RecN